MTDGGGETPEEKKQRREVERKRERQRHFWIFIGIIVGVFTIQLVCWCLMDSLITSEEKRGQFGDMFGAVNTLFSGMAFGCIIYTILLQRADLEATRQEMERSADAHEANCALMKEQLKIEELKYKGLMLPVFVDDGGKVSPQGDKPPRLKKYIRNHGQSIRNISIPSITNDKYKILNFERAYVNKMGQFLIIYEFSSTFRGEIPCIAEFVTLDNKVHQVELVLKVNPELEEPDKYELFQREISEKQ